MPGRGGTEPAARETNAAVVGRTGTAAARHAGTDTDALTHCAEYSSLSDKATGKRRLDADAAATHGLESSPAASEYTKVGNTSWPTHHIHHVHAVHQSTPSQ